MSQSEQFHEVYSTMRDSTRNSERAAICDAIETHDHKGDRLRAQLYDLDNPCGPIPRPCDKPMTPPGVYPQGNAEARAQLDFHKAMIAQLGGSRTVKPAEGCEIEPYIRHIR